MWEITEPTRWFSAMPVPIRSTRTAGSRPWRRTWRKCPTTLFLAICVAPPSRCLQARPPGNGWNFYGPGYLPWYLSWSTYAYSGMGPYCLSPGAPDTVNTRYLKESEVMKPSQMIALGDTTLFAFNIDMPNVV